MRYRVRHTYKPKIVIPVNGIGDNVECRALNVEEKHLCDLESEIQSIYNCDAWSWVKRWYKIDNWVSDLRVIIMDLEKLC